MSTHEESDQCSSESENWGVRVRSPEEINSDFDSQESMLIDDDESPPCSCYSCHGCKNCMSEESIKGWRSPTPNLEDEGWSTPSPPAQPTQPPPPPPPQPLENLEFQQTFTFNLPEPPLPISLRPVCITVKLGNRRSVQLIYME